MSGYSDESRVELVWNKGIAALCDRRIPDEFPNGRYSPVAAGAGGLASSKHPDNLIPHSSAYRNIQDGELIWVRLSWLKSFVAQVLPLIEARFVLVTGDSDSSVPSELISEARDILRSSKLIHWYTQNYDGSIETDKISPIPIGIDFHTLGERPYWGESISSPLEQERVLNEIRSSLPRADKRIPKAYVDFAWKSRRGVRARLRKPKWLRRRLTGAYRQESRREILAKLRGNPEIFCQSEPMSRSETWRTRGLYAFVVSPHGVGLDCHRTWEALALGHIVLVPSSSLDCLYSGLPVVPLRDWSEITADNLKKWLSLYGNDDARHPKLTSRCWVEEMRARVARDNNRVMVMTACERSAP